ERPFPFDTPEDLLADLRSIGEPSEPIWMCGICGSPASRQLDKRYFCDRHDPNPSQSEIYAPKAVQNAPGSLLSDRQGSGRTPPETSQVILGADNDVSSLFPNLHPMNLEVWREEAEAEQERYDRLRREFEMERGL